MRTVTVTFDDGSRHVYNGVPLDVTPEQMISRVERDFPRLRATNIDGGSSETPKKENPNLEAVDPELRRMQNAAERFAEAGAQPQQPQATKYQQKQAGYLDRKQQIAAYERQIQELQALQAETGDDSLRDAAANLATRVAELKKQLHSDHAGTGGMIGGAIGSLAGAVTGPAAPIAVPVLGTAGGLLGTVIGGLFDARSEEMTEEEKEEYLKDRAIESVVYDIAGNILFVGGGKVMATLAKADPAYAAAVRKLGGIIKPANSTNLNAPREIIRPGERVFESTGKDELRDAAVRGGGALNVASAPRGSKVAPVPDMTPTRGQLTGEPGLMEQIARTKDKGYFDDVRRTQEDALGGKLSKYMERIKGRNASQYAGEDVRAALDATEDEVKRYLRPVWDDLKKLQGDVVDIAGLRRDARGALAANSTADGLLLRGEELEIVKRLAAGKRKKLSAEEAHQIASRFSARARDLESAVEPNSPLRAFYSKVANEMRTQLDLALASKPHFKEARELYKEMMDVVYDPALAVARRGGESGAGRKAIKIGEVEGVAALDKLRSLARKVDILTGTSALGKQADTAFRGARGEFFEKYAGTSDALASLHTRMGDPDFRRTFTAAFPDPRDRRIIESLSQAAQMIGRLRSAGGGAPGYEAAAASAGRAAGSAVGGATAANAASLLARAGAWFVPKKIARAMTIPEIKAELPRLSRIIQAAAHGTLIAIPEATRKAIEAMESMPDDE